MQYTQQTKQTQVNVGNRDWIRSRAASTHQPQHIAELVRRITALGLEQLHHAYAQAPRHAAHEIRHLLPSETELGLELRVTAPVDRVAAEHRPRAVAALRKQMASTESNASESKASAQPRHRNDGVRCALCGEATPTSPDG